MLGHPVAHSLSPALHRAAYAELGLDWRFDAVDVDADDLAAFIARVEATGAPGPAWRGVALTMPLKRAVLVLLDEADDLVRTVGAANTLLWEPDGSRRGANTDVPGLVDALRASGPTHGPATVLGGGATAASAVAALAILGHRDVSVRVREPRRAGGVRQVAERVGVDVQVEAFDARWAAAVGVLVSTVPSAAAAAAVPGPGWHWAAEHAPVVLDVGYDPWPSVLLERAAANGARTVTGIELLVHQARAQLALMCGRDVPVATLRDAAAAALRDRGGTDAGYRRRS